MYEAYAYVVFKSLPLLELSFALVGVVSNKPYDAR